MTPARRKQTASHRIQGYKLNERTACQWVGIRRTGDRYQAMPRDDQALRVRRKPFATEQSAYGYGLLHGMLKAEGFVINKQRTYRVYTEEGLQVRTKTRKKAQRPRQPMDVPFQVNPRGSMDVVSDQLSRGRRFRVLNGVDEYSREVIGQLVSVSISGQQVARVLNPRIEQPGKPGRMICDNGTEFTRKALFVWRKESGVEPGFIPPGKPTQNAFVESVNGTFRNECLNRHWFRSLEEARLEIDAWRYQYNHVRPHSSLNYLPPVVFAKHAA